MVCLQGLFVVLIGNVAQGLSIRLQNGRLRVRAPPFPHMERFMSIDQLIRKEPSAKRIVWHDYVWN